MTTHDVIVIGAGAGGLSASRTVMRFGKRAVLVTDGPIGGDCTFTGCVPSKTLIEAAEAGKSFTDAMALVHETVAHIAATENTEVLRGEGVDVVEGRATITGAGQVQVGDQTLSAKHVIIATGARPQLPPIDGIETAGVRTSDSVWEMTEAPEQLAVIGGGAIGSELSQAMAQLGVDVTLYEFADRLLSNEEPAASEVVEKALTTSGVAVRTATGVAAAHRVGDQIELSVGEETASFDEVIVATGRQPNSENLGLETVGIETTARGHIITNDKLKTTASNFWAVGDVTEKLPFTHAADEMGRLAAWNTRAPVFKFKPEIIPWVTFTNPEVARVGVRESEAPKGSRVVELPMGENDRAITADNTGGFIKVIVAPKRLTRNVGGGRVVGATIVGPRAGEMIHELSLAMRTNMFAGRLAQSVHAYPTWSVGIQKAMAQLFFEIEGREARPAKTSD